MVPLLLEHFLRHLGETLGFPVLPKLSELLPFPGLLIIGDSKNSLELHARALLCPRKNHIVIPTSPPKATPGLL